MTKKKAFLNVVAILIFGLFALASLEEEKPVKVDDETQQKIDTVKSDFKLGDEIKFNDFTLLINDFEEGKIYDSFYPETGMKFVAVEVLVTNISKEPVDYNSLFDFKISDDNSYEYDICMFGAKEPSLKAGNINAGRKIRGWLTFEVKKEAKEFEIVYSPSLLTSQQFFIKLVK